MPRKGANVSLSSYDDIFSTEQSRMEAGQEHVQEIPVWKSCIPLRGIRLRYWTMKRWIRQWRVSGRSELLRR